MEIVGVVMLLLIPCVIYARMHYSRKFTLVSGHRTGNYIVEERRAHKEAIKASIWAFIRAVIVLSWTFTAIWFLME